MTRCLLTLLLLTVSALGQRFTPGDAAFMQSTSPLRRGLVGYWRLEEASGTRYDCSKNGNHLTANNSPGQAAGKVGNCVTTVSASSQWLSATSNSSLQFGSGDWTAVVWVKFTSLTIGIIHGKYRNDVNKREWALRLSATNQIQVNLSGNGSTTTDLNISNSFATNTWYFVACGRQTGTNWVALNNGTRSTVTAVNLFSSDGGYAIGGTVNGLNLVDAAIDEAGLWSRSLSDFELIKVYNSGVGTHFPWAHP